MTDMDDILNREITIKEGIQMGLISCKVLAYTDIWQRVNTIIESENIPKTHAMERVAETCKVHFNTVWTAYSMTQKLSQK